MAKTLSFVLPVLLSSPALAERFNREYEGSFSYDNPENLFRFSWKRDESGATYNGVGVSLRGKDDEDGQEGFWDADVEIDVARGLAIVRGSDGPSGGTGNYRAEVNAAGEVVSTDHPYAAKGFEPLTIEVEPVDEEAADAIRVAFGDAVREV